MYGKPLLFENLKISVKTDTQLKVEKLDPTSEVVVQESFDRSTKYLITNMQIPWREQTFVMMRLLPHPMGKIRQLKHLFPSRGAPIATSCSDFNVNLQIATKFINNSSR